jgi:hypothetical protein
MLGKARCGKAFGGVDKFEWLKKLVDEMRKALHNLISLLLTQRRKTVAKFGAVERCDL